MNSIVFLQKPNPYSQPFSGFSKDSQPQADFMLVKESLLNRVTFRIVILLNPFPSNVSRGTLKMNVIAAKDTRYACEFTKTFRPQHRSTPHR